MEAEIPRGERSAFVDRLIERELNQYDTRKSSLAGRSTQKEQDQREVERSASLDQLVQEYDQRLVRAQAS